MSFGNEKPILFGTTFVLFYLYWNYNRDRMQQRLSEEAASNLQNSVYIKLSALYQKNNWDLRELDWTCSMINRGLDCVNPYQFLNQQHAYLGHVQNLFYITNI